MNRTSLALLVLLAFVLPRAQAAPPQATFYAVEGRICDQGWNKGTPVPDGTVLKLYWDVNNNGPDDKDPMPVVGEDALNVNWNAYTIVSDSVWQEKGQVATDPGLYVVGDLPDVPKYYFRICLSDYSLVSDVITLVSGYQEIMLKSWTVGPKCK